MTIKISDAGIALVKQFEGCKLEAYRDAVGIWTVGFGHTGPDVHPGMKITQEEADDLLADDLKVFEHCVNSAVSVPLTQGEFDACVSLAFNIGCGRFRASTLVRKLVDNDDSASTEFLRWNKAGGRVLAGLTRRREAEKDLFESAIT